MQTVLLLMTLGIGIGFLLSKYPKIIQSTEKAICWAIYLLLFLLGISVGANQHIVSNLATLGWQAFVVASGSILGSVAFAWLLYYLVFKNNENNKTSA